jgi:hypothetical protein
LGAVWSGVSSEISANSGLQPQQNRLMKKVSRRCMFARVYEPGHVCSASADINYERIRAVADERFKMHPLPFLPCTFSIQINEYECSFRLILPTNAGQSDM